MLILQEAVVTAANEVSLRALELNWLPEPFQRPSDVFPFWLAIFVEIRLVLITKWVLEELFSDSLIPCGDSPEYGLSHLGFQVKCISNVVIQDFIKLRGIKFKPMFEDVLRYEIASLTEQDNLFTGRGNHNLDSLDHSGSPPFNTNVVAYIVLKDNIYS